MLGSHYEQQYESQPVSNDVTKILKNNVIHLFHYSLVYAIFSYQINKNQIKFIS